MESKNRNHIKNRKLFLLKLIIKAFYWKIRGDEAKMMSAIADGFLNLGGVYVKFLQGVLLQIPIMKLWKSEHRFDVYENVPLDVIDVGKLLNEQLNKQQLKEFESISTKPFASGSFGQVYKATLKNKEKVIIKVLRPNTRKNLKSDLRLIGVVSKLLASMVTTWNVDLKTLVRQFIRSTITETDYIAEAKFSEDMYGYYQDNPTIKIPKTYKKLSNKNVIVQEYIDGLSIAQLMREQSSTKKDYKTTVLEQTGSDLRAQLQQLGVELNLAVLKSGLIHGDPHAGNIRLLPNNRVALLDFGVQTKPLKYPNAFYAVLKEFWRAEYLNEPNPGNIFVAYIRFYAGKLYESLKLVSEYASKKSGKPTNIKEWIVQFSNKAFEDKVSSESLLAGLERIKEGEEVKPISVDRIVNPGNRFQIGVKINDGSILRTMANYLSLVTELGYRSVIPHVYNEVVEYVEKYLPHLKAEPPASVGLEEAIEIVYFWLEKIGRNDTALFNQIMSYVNGVSSTPNHQAG